MTELEQFFMPGTTTAQSTPAASVQTVTGAILLAFVLTLLIGVVYQRTHRGARYSQDFVHALVLLGTLVTVVIMGIGQNIAAAFGIFAAFSIIRFRRSLPEARDIGFVFFAMSVGLAVGSGEYALAIVTTLLVSGFAVLLARFDLFAPQRASHILRVRVTNDIDYESAFEEVLRTMTAAATLISVESVQAGMMTEVRYAVRLADGASPREVVTAFQERNGNNRVILAATDLELETD